MCTRYYCIHWYYEILELLCVYLENSENIAERSGLCFEAVVSETQVCLCVPDVCSWGGVSGERTADTVFISNNSSINVFLSS